LKRIISRFEYILNTYLREFVRLSIDDWVSFIKSFTIPNYEKGELWKVQPTPMIVIHLSFRMHDKEDKKKQKKDKGKGKDKEKDKKGKDKAGEKDKKDKKGGEDDEDEEEEDEDNTVNFHPKINKCMQFLNNALKMIVISTNKVCNLEDDLMPFLQKEK
jgi:hypothetical protein